MKILVLLLSIFCTQVNALEFIRIAPNVYAMDGAFDESTYYQLKDLLEQNESVTILPYSTGGNAEFIREMMGLIMKHGNVHVVVDPNGYCISACAFTLSAAKTIYGRFAYHPVISRNIITGEIRSDIWSGLLNADIMASLISLGMRQDLAFEVTQSYSRDLVYVSYNGNLRNITMIIKTIRTRIK